MHLTVNYLNRGFLGSSHCSNLLVLCICCILGSLFLLFVLRTQAEMGHTCRGTINLATANIAVEDSCNFVISNGGAQIYHLKANSEVERQRWITALELAKAKAVHMQAESGETNEKSRRLNM